MAKIERKPVGCVVCPDHFGSTLSTYVQWKHDERAEEKIRHYHMCESCCAAYESMRIERVLSNGWHVTDLYVYSTS